MHEIVTLQIGSQSNYLATHFWNAQESYFTYGGQTESPVDHDVHFRPGVGADGSDTYTPRTVIYDFRNAFGTLKKVNALYDTFEQDGSRNNIWEGTTVPQQLPQISENEYQRNLNEGLDPPALSESSVRYWSDYTRVFYHPRSIVQIYETEIDPGARSFENWSTGQELFSNLDKEHDLFDRDMRPFIEECDQMQGIQLLTSVEDSWSGFSARYLDRLRDEFAKLPIWLWAVGKPKPLEKTRHPRGIANEARALFEMNPHVSMYLPLAISPRQYPSSFSINPYSLWETSALQATMFETITLPSRLRRAEHQTPATLDDLAMTLDRNGNRRIAQLDFSIFDSEGLETSITSRSAADRYCSFFPHGKSAPADEEEGSKHFSTIVVDRGRARPGESTDGDIIDTDRNRHDTTTKLHTPLAFPLLDSFPPVYKLGIANPKQAGLEARLYNSPNVLEWVQSLVTATRRVVGIEDREEAVDGLQTIAQEYKKDMFSGSEDENWED